MSSSSPTAATPNPSEVLTLADLARWSRPAPSLAVLGHPVGHSVSPQMHNAALAHLRAAHPELAGWQYYKFDVPPEQLREALARFRQQNFRGLNLTLPHKVEAAGLSNDIDPEARDMWAVNTLLPAGTEAWKGFNTDGFGLTQALHRELQAGLKSTPVVLLGAGGAARGAAVTCLKAGCSMLRIANRDRKRLRDLFSDLRPFDQHKVLRTSGLETLPVENLPPGAVIVNATSSSRVVDEILARLVAKLRVERAARIYDMNYRREGVTPLVAAARARGLRAADGLSMLVWQGVRSLEIWTGLALQATVVPQIMLDAACAALGLPQRTLTHKNVKT